MSIMNAIEKLDTTNKEQKSNLELLHEQFIDLQADPRFAGLPMDALENLFSEYLRIWIKGNTEIMEMLLKDKNSYSKERSH